MTFFFRHSPLFIFLLTLACSPNKPAPMMDAPEMKTAQGSHSLAARKQPTHPLKLFAEYDKCTRFKYCKALDYLNLYFSSGEPESNYKLLTGVLSD